jgi:hypothetical protein
MGTADSKGADGERSNKAAGVFREAALSRKADGTSEEADRAAVAGELKLKDGRPALASAKDVPIHLLGSRIVPGKEPPPMTCSMDRRRPLIASSPLRGAACFVALRLIAVCAVGGVRRVRQ